MINMKIVFCFTFVFLTGCDTTDVNFAEVKVEEFHNNFNEKKFEYIYDTMLSKEFKESIKRENGIPFMHNIYNMFGGYQSSKLKKTNIITGVIGSKKVELFYHSTYDKYSLDELFILKKESGDYKIIKVEYSDTHPRKNGVTSNH